MLLKPPLPNSYHHTPSYHTTELCSTCIQRSHHNTSTTSTHFHKPHHGITIPQPPLHPLILLSLTSSSFIVPPPTTKVIASDCFEDFLNLPELDVLKHSVCTPTYKALLGSDTPTALATFKKMRTAEAKEVLKETRIHSLWATETHKLSLRLSNEVGRLKGENGQVEFEKDGVLLVAKDAVEIAEDVHAELVELTWGGGESGRWEDLRTVEEGDEEEGKE
ncbi:hypothetical protein B0J14DRAFT_646512 [Halenospora varia]|nr:hypothetical protein B0J14DRAFT_646512 [Halenospora varia]